MVLCIRPAIDFVFESIGFLTGWRGDVWYMQQIAGPFATWFIYPDLNRSGCVFDFINTKPIC